MPATPWPIGTILWVKSLADIPVGWQLADGTNGTRNVLDLVIPGAGGTYAVGDTGGFADLQINHDHTISAMTWLPSTHHHPVSITSTDDSSGLTNANYGGTNPDGPHDLANATHHHTDASFDPGDPAIGGSLSFDLDAHHGSGTTALSTYAFSNFPPTVALYPIQRIA